MAFTRVMSGDLKCFHLDPTKIPSTSLVSSYLPTLLQLGGIGERLAPLFCLKLEEMALQPLQDIWLKRAVTFGISLAGLPRAALVF